MTKECLDCKYPMTWAQQRVQFGRLVKRGLSREETKAAMPRCQTCVTRMLNGAISIPVIRQTVTRRK